MNRRGRSHAVRLGLVALLAAPAAANHGPGTSGGGASVASGETLRAGGFDLSLRTDLTRFESVSRAEAAQRAIQSGEFDALDRSFVESLSIAYGVTDDFQVGAQIGWYSGDNFVAAEEDGLGGATVATADPSGITDTWLSAKLRVMRGASGHLALMAGVKLPTGKDDVRLSNGDPLEPSSQPGTGAVDGQLGLAWSKFLASRTTVDASAQYTLRGEHDGFRVGDRADAGVALAYRLTQDVKAFPNWSVSGELLGVWLDKDDDRGELNENSGGTTVYLAPGVRDRVNPHVSFSLAPAFPIVQDLNGDQIETRAKLVFSLSFSL